MINLLGLLDKEKTKLKMNEGEFAKYLGIHNTLWSQIKHDKRKINLSFLTIITIKFPSLRLEVAQYITEQVMGGFNGK